MVIAELCGGPHGKGIQVALPSQGHASSPQPLHAGGIVRWLVACQDSRSGGCVQILRTEGILSVWHALECKVTLNIRQHRASRQGAGR